MIDLTTEDTPPLALLASVQLPDVDDAELDESLAELGRLAKTLGLEVMGRVTQRRPHFDAGTYLGSGKVAELKEAVDTLRADHPNRGVVVLLDHEVTPSQARQLEKATGADVNDRTALILDIFHRHASSREARAQVEIVRLGYMAPRLREQRRGKGERQRGGIGGKGAGESGMELDRRKVRDRIAELEEELARIAQDRKTQRARRQELRRVALVGYTNAGKSTMMRALTGSDVYVADKLFATLDTTVRALQPPVDPPVVVSDTVGFIRKLPHGLVASFKSTLDEALEASLLLHMVDAADPALDAHMATTNQVLADIGAGNIPTRLVLNKCDKVDAERLAELRSLHPDALMVSAKSVEDVVLVHDAIVAAFEGQREEAWVAIPHAQGALRAMLLAGAELIEERYDEEAGHYRVRASAGLLERVRGALAG
ncbi:MAG: GTPase HflX [Myxococcales bacterium]